MRDSDVLKRIFEASNVNVAHVGLDARMIRVNRAFAAAHGLEPEAFAGRRYRELYEEHGAGEIFDEIARPGFAALTRVVETGEAVTLADVSWRLPHDPARIVHYDWTMLPVTDADGLVTSVVFVSVDVTARHEAEERLRASEARLRALNEASLDLTAIVDARGVVSHASAAARELLGLGPEDLVGRSLLAIVDPRDRDLAERVLRGALRPERAAPLDLRLRTVDGAARLVETSLVDLPDEPSVRGTVFTFRDVTERRLLAERVRQMEKLDAVARVAAGTAHDFNNLLHVVRGYTQLLQGSTLEPEQLRWAAAIESAVERAADLSSRLLQLGRRRPTEEKVVDLAKAIEEFSPLLRQAVPDAIALELDVDARPLPVRAERADVEQVLMNLVTNARDAIRGEGRIVIAAELRDEAAEATAVSPPLPPGRYGAISVTDTGAGIPDDALPHIFEPFFTTKGEEAGTGLGLVSVYRIAADRGGGVAARSRADDGTTISVYLPAA